MARRRRKYVCEEKQKEGKRTMRGGRRVVIKDRIEVNTSSLHSTDNSIIILEFYEGNWHCSHNYNTPTKSGSFVDSGYATTREVLEYLRKEKQRIPKRIKNLGIIKGNLEETIIKLEMDAD